MHVTAETGMQEAVLGTYRESDLDEIYEMLSSQQMDLKNGKGTIAAAKDGMLLLSIFYDPDMQIYVDGKKVDGKSIQGLTGVKLSAGTHTVTMKYRTPGLQAGSSSFYINSRNTGNTLVYQQKKNGYFRQVVTSMEKTV